MIFKWNSLRCLYDATDLERVHQHPQKLKNTLPNILEKFQILMNSVENGFSRFKNIEIKMRTLTNTVMTPSKTVVKAMKSSALSITQNHHSNIL